MASAFFDKVTVLLESHYPLHLRGDGFILVNCRTTEGDCTSMIGSMPVIDCLEELVRHYLRTEGCSNEGAHTLAREIREKLETIVFAMNTIKSAAEPPAEDVLAGIEVGVEGEVVAQVDVPPGAIVGSDGSVITDATIIVAGKPEENDGW